VAGEAGYPYAVQLEVPLITVLGVPDGPHVVKDAALDMHSQPFDGELLVAEARHRLGVLAGRHLER
jgi:hypothetical protein